MHGRVRESCCLSILIVCRQNSMCRGRRSIPSSAARTTAALGPSTSASAMFSSVMVCVMCALRCPVASLIACKGAGVIARCNNSTKASRWRPVWNTGQEGSSNSWSLQGRQKGQHDQNGSSASQ